MQLSEAQLQTLGKAGYEDRLLRLLHEHAAQAVQRQPEAGVRERIQAFTREALAWGLVDERSAATYVLAGFQLGEGFDERVPGLRQVLASTMAPSSKAQALSDFTVALFRRMALAEAGAAGAAAW